MVCRRTGLLGQALAETPEPGTGGSLLDNTTIVWTNELGKGNSHTLRDIPFVLIGNGMGFQMGRSLNFKGPPTTDCSWPWPTAWSSHRHLRQQETQSGRPLDLS